MRGFRSDDMRRAIPLDVPEPSIFWSVPNDVRYPPRIKATPRQAPRLQELTLVGDTGFALSGDRVLRLNSVDAATKIRRGSKIWLPDRRGDYNQPAAQAHLSISVASIR